MGLFRRVHLASHPASVNSAADPGAFQALRCSGGSDVLSGICEESVPPMAEAPSSPLAARRSGPLQGRVRAPGDKSISHRALIFGALTVGETRISGLLEGADVLHTAEAMRALGATVERTREGEWRVRGVGVAGCREPPGLRDF